MSDSPNSLASLSEAWSGRRLGLATLVGAAYGLLMRLAFGFPFFKGAGDASGPMLASFVFAVPLLVGAVSVFMLPPGQRTLGRSLVVPVLPIAVFVAGTAVLLIEGSICIVMAMPIFVVTAMLGGFVTGLLLMAVQPRPATFGAVLLLPLALGAVERDFTPRDDYRQSRASVHIDAPPAAIWQLINNARDIRPEEMQQGLAWRIGVPLPLEAVTVPDGDDRRVRKLRWDKGVHFDEPILAWDENRYIQWRYVFAPDSVPAGALDDHVAIGGRYFDLVDTAYRLTPEGGGTRLDIVVNYRVSTSFNAYAGWWARVLVDDAAQAILGFYERRAEGPA